MVRLLVLDVIDSAVFVCSLLMQAMMQWGRTAVRRRSVIFHLGSGADIREPALLLDLLNADPVFDQASSVRASRVLRESDACLSVLAVQGVILNNILTLKSKFYA
jgi:hypothetical protein